MSNTSNPELIVAYNALNHTVSNNNMVMLFDRTTTSIIGYLNVKCSALVKKESPTTEQPHELTYFHSHWNHCDAASSRTRGGSALTTIQCLYSVGEDEAKRL